MSERDPRLLPGPGAQRVRSLASGGLVAYLVLLALSGLFVVSLRVLAGVVKHSPVLDFVVPATIGLVLLSTAALATAIAMSEWAYRIEGQEIGAGYTTILGRFDQVDGVDAKSGVVIRPAVHPHMAPPNGDAITTGAELGPGPRVLLPRQIIFRTPAHFYLLLGSVVAAAALAYVGFASLAHVSPILAAELALGIFAGLSLAGSLGVWVSGQVVAPRAYVEALGRQFSTALVYATQVNDSDAVLEFRTPGDRVLPHAELRHINFAVFDEADLIVYSRYRTSLLPFLCIPRSRIRADKTTVDSRRVTVQLHVVKDDGSRTVLPLFFGGLSGLVSSAELSRTREQVMDWSSATH